jgi:PAS domain S-box-containing protein
MNAIVPFFLVLSGHRLFRTLCPSHARFVCGAIVAFLCWWIATAPVTAQAPPDTEDGFLPAPRFTHLTNEDGLAQNRVTALLQDRLGFMWIGTGNGLSRYDGYTLTTFRHDADTPNSLGGNNITSIIEAQDGTLWIGSTDGGLTHYQPQTNTFTRYKHSPEQTRRNLGALIAYDVYEDSTGRVWFTGPGNIPLSWVNPATGAVTDIRLALTTPQNALRSLYAIQEDAQGNLWITADNALVRFDPATEEVIPYVTEEEGGRLTDIVPDPAGGWWMSAAAGLYHFDSNTETLRLANGEVRGGNAILMGQDGFLWVASINGLFQIDPRTEAVVRHLKAVPTDAHSLSEDQLVTLYQDRDGLIWSGTANNGVDRFDSDLSQFSFYRYDPEMGSGLAEGSVNEIAGQGNARLWVATNEVLNEIALDSQQVAPLSLPVPPALITVLFPDSQGNLWIGMGQGRLIRHDPITDASTVLDLPAPPVPEAPAGGGPPPREGGPSEAVGATRNVTAILEQADGSMLVTVARNGFYRVSADATAGEWIPIEQATSDTGQSVPVPPEVTALAMDGNGVVWIGYGGGILAQLDLTVPTARFAPNTFTDTGMIEDLHVDRSGRLWMATQRGLIGTNAQGERVLYSEAEGLPSSYTVSIAEDGTGHLWVGTQNGLARFNPATNEIQVYGVAEGVQEQEFLRQSVWQLDDGRMAFGGRRGLTLFHPDQITTNTDSPTVVLTDLRLFNESVRPAPDTLLSEPLWNTEAITLNHDQDIISFEFTGLGFRAPAENRYRYQLVGFDPTWNEVDSSRRFATYTNLPAGWYTLRVQQQLSDGSWGEPGASLSITVTPPWWETLWFRVAMGVIVGSTILALVAWRSAQLRRRTTELEAQVAARTQELAESEARFRGLSTSTFEAVIIHDAGEILDLNRAALDLFGYPANELIGQSLRTMIAPAFHDQLEARLKHPSQDPYEIEGITNAGTRLPLEVRDREIPFGGKSVRVAAVRDLTSRRQIENQRERVAALEERERIGRELHDDLGQVIGYVAVQAQAALTRLAQGEMDETGAILRQLTDAAHEAHDDVRQYITGIRTRTPATSFREALERYIAQVESRYGLRVLVSYPAELLDSPMTPEVETQALRIIQEALTNVRKHAQVQQARLIFTDHAEDIQLIISDEGRGFTYTGEATTSATAANFGLSIMRERAEAVGGSLTVRSSPGAGTQVVVRLPRLLNSVAATGLGGIRVLVVDDHPLYLEGLRNLLAARGLRIVGVARDGVEAQERARALRPDLILMDVEMPKRDGLEATRLIKAELPTTKIVMLTVAADEAQLFQALQYGASGYLLKDLEGDRFFQMLGDVVRGETVLSPNLAAQVIHGFASQEELLATDMESDPIFTTRQQEVLTYIARGLSNKEIAAALHISERTVKHHVGLMLERLNLRSRYELAHYAQTHGLGSRNSDKE